MRFRNKLLIAVLVLLVVIVGISFIKSPKELLIDTPALADFTTEGFISAEDLGDTAHLVASNPFYELWINEETSHFNIVDLVSGEIWNSNTPLAENNNVLDDFPNLIPETKNLQRSTLIIHYQDKRKNDIGSVQSINNWMYSIDHEDGQQTFSLKYIENGVQVLYDIEDLTIDNTAFPQYIEKERFEELFVNSGCLTDYEIGKITTYYELKANEGYYEILSYDNMSGIVIGRLQQYMYDTCGYTIEDTEYDNLQNGVVIALRKPRFEVAVEYILTEEGFNAKIINNSIVEEDYSPIVYIDLLPYFGSASVDDDGYMFIPDGTGAIMNLNNGKTHQERYSKRIYGTDLSEFKTIQPEAEESITLPVFGMAKTSSDVAYLAIINNGASQASIIADISGRKDSYNRLYSRVHYREVQLFQLGTSFDVLSLEMWTKERVALDYEINFIFLRGEEANYVGMAKVYRNYLINEKSLLNVDTTDDVILNVNIVGAFNKKEFVLGVPYDSDEKLTTFDNTKTIIEDLNKRGITSIDISLQAWANGGIKQTLNNKIKVEKVLGGEKGLKSLINYSKDLGIDIYPEMSLMKTNDYSIMFASSRLSTKSVDGGLMEIYPYNFATKLMDYTKGKTYIISPRYYNSIAQGFINDYEEYNLDSIRLNYLGSVIASDYDKNNLIFRNEAVLYQIKALEYYQESGITDIAVSNAFGYTLPYITKIYDAPLETSMYQIFDDSVPFYQLVVSGLIDYSGMTINENSSRTLDWFILKSIETGSNVDFTWSYEDSSILLGTDYEEYFYTNYHNWITKASYVVNQLQNTGIYDGYLVNHTIIAPGVYLVEYSNGVEVVLNYTNVAYVYEGHSILSENFTVVAGD